VQLPRLGRARLKEHDYIPLGEKVLSATDSEQARHCFVSVLVEEMLRESQPAKGERSVVVVIEDLNVKGMLKNHELALAIADVGFGRFKEFLEYKTAWAGERLVKANRF